MNILLTSAGRRGYLAGYFKEALKTAGCGGLVHAANSSECPAFASADRSVITPLIYDKGYISFLLEYCKKEAIGLLVPLLILMCRCWLQTGPCLQRWEPWW